MRHPVRRLHHCTHPRGRGGAIILALLGAALALPCTADNLVPNHSFEELDPETAAPEGWTNWATPNFAVYTLATARTGVAAVAGPFASSSSGRCGTMRRPAAVS